MKTTKKLLAAAVLAAFGTSVWAAPTVTIYGTVDTALVYQHSRTSYGGDVGQALGEKGITSGSTDTLSMESGINEPSKWGLRGEEKIGGATVAFNLQSGINTDDGTTKQGGRLFGREALLSVSGKYGTLAAGRIGAVGSSCGTFDITQAIAESFDGFDYLDMGMTLTDRYDNMLTYQTPKYAGLQATLQYSFKTDQKDGVGTEGKASANRYAGAAVTYEIGKLQSVLSYEFLDHSNISYNSKDGHIISLGANYDFGVAQVFGLAKYVTGVNTFAGYYADDYAEDVGAALAEEGLDGVTFRGAKGYNLHLGAIVPMFGGSLTGGLYYADGDAKLSNGLAKVDLKAFGASFKYAYPLSKRTDIYCGVDFAQQKVDNLKVLGTGVSGDEKDTNTAVFAGLTHRF